MKVNEIIELLSIANKLASIAIDAAEKLPDMPTEILDAIDDLNQTSVRL